MKSGSATFLIPAFVIAVFAIGLARWRIPYAEVSMPGSLFGLSAIAVVVIAASAIAFGGCRFWPTIIVLGTATPTAVMARVVFEGMRDPTSHNLWPFEVALALFTGVLIALCGATAGALLRWAADGVPAGDQE